MRHESCMNEMNLRVSLLDILIYVMDISDCRVKVVSEDWLASTSACKSFTLHRVSYFDSLLFQLFNINITTNKVNTGKHTYLLSGSGSPATVEYIRTYPQYNQRKNQ